MPIKKTPSFLETARAFYGDAFGARKKRDLAAAMAEWAEMDPGEQSFAVAHLMYLDLQAQAQTHLLLGHLRDLLDELAEAFTAALVASLEQAEPNDDTSPFDAPPADDPEPTVIDANPAPGDP